jgi:hypothetical protein
MTGSKAQLYNGITLLATFFGCRLVYGNIQSLLVYIDMWHAVRAGPTMPLASASPANASIAYGNEDIMMFAKDATPIPVWLALVYVISNIVLNGLNIHWFFKMIAAVRKRFEPAKKTELGVPATNAQTTGSKIGLDSLDELRKRTVPEIIPAIGSDLGGLQ